MTRESIYEILDGARRLPGAYGVGGPSYRLLQAFIGGLSWGELDAGEPNFWEFRWWMAARCGEYPTSHPGAKLRAMPDEEAYGRWYELFDEYRACRVVELARLPGSVVRFGESWRGENGKPAERYVRKQPEAIRLGQFAPSSVYFAEQLGGDGDEKLTESFRPTIEEARDAARGGWGVDPAAWGIGD